jgi:hypothetical protein
MLNILSVGVCTHSNFDGHQTRRLASHPDDPRVREGCPVINTLLEAQVLRGAQVKRGHDVLRIRIYVANLLWYG